MAIALMMDTSPVPPPRRVAQTSLNFHSDVARTDRVIHPCGVLHAVRGGASGDREEHSFAWIEDAGRASAAVSHLASHGFPAGRMRFVPFSSEVGWAARYPHAAPHMRCDGEGRLHSTQLPDGDGGATPAGLAARKRARGRPPPKLLARGRLPDAERDELHIEIWRYLAWLHDELAGTETSAAGRRRLQGAGTHVPGLRGVVAKLEATFRAVRTEKERDAREAPPLVFAEAPPLAVPETGGGQSLKGTFCTKTPPMPQREQLQLVKPLPFLENALESKLQRRVENRCARSAGDGATGCANDRRETCTSRRKDDFEAMYRKLLGFKQEKGHASPPVTHPSLGRWVAELRRKKRILRERGREHEPDAEEEESATEGGQRDANTPAATSAAAGEPGDAHRPDLVSGVVEGAPQNPLVLPNAEAAAELLQSEGEGGDPDTAPANVAAEKELAGPHATPRKRGCRSADPRKSNTFLTCSRVQRLDAIGFAWCSKFNFCSEACTWDERLEQLRQFKDRHGKWPANRDGALGGWLKGQKVLYSKRDENFMANKFPQLEAMGVPLRHRHYTIMSWEDRFQQLVEFGRVNRHFKVPNPMPNSGEGQRWWRASSADYQAQLQDPDVAEASRFYKFVKKIHTEYRALQRGIPSSMLTEERIQQLQRIGFQFSTKAEREVPELDWGTRIQQLEGFRNEVGHLRVDPNYNNCSNLGGWAVEMSDLHRRWQGGEHLPPDMIEKFNQLMGMGFSFDIFPSKRGERSWEDSYNLLIKYRQETGSTRVPHHYKADFRLGSWVSVQRTEYKALLEGKPSRLTNEKIQRLDAIGFEWAARRGK